MDFIARSGSLINQSYRIAGILFVLLVLQSIFLLQLYNGNRERDHEFQKIRDELKVYVVPGSQAGIYSPSTSDLLLENFVSHVSQSLHTYTYQNWNRQYQELRNFFTPKFLRDSTPKFERLITNVQAEGRSSLFVPDRASLKVTNIDVSAGNIEQKRVTLEGEQTTLLGGDPLETDRIRITMIMNVVPVTRTNPFGFMLADYDTQVINTREIRN